MGEPLAYVLSASDGYVWIERRRLLRDDGDWVIVSRPMMPNGEKRGREVVAFNWPDAVAKYWDIQRLIRNKLRKQLRALEVKIAAGKEPRFLKREK